MKIAKSIEYAATPQEVFAVLSDVKFQEAKCAATAAIKHSASIETVGDRTVITTERDPAERRPARLRQVDGGRDPQGHRDPGLGPGLRPTAAARGTVEMAVAGAPIALNGHPGAARPAAGGTVEQLDAELKAKIPLIGGKIEKAAAPPIEEAIDIEHRTAQEWLAR